MLFYRYGGMADGSKRWAVEQKSIGTGWSGFRQVFAGARGAIYGIRGDGQMLFYRYAGMADGSNRWAVEQKPIGTGWDFTLVTAGAVAVAAPPVPRPSPPPVATPAPARNDPTCRRYADDAVRAARQKSRCSRRTGDQGNPGRWSEDFNVQYDWCHDPRTQPEWRRLEAKARDDLLVSCGARSRL